MGNETTRRSFLKHAATGAAAVTWTAKSYSQINGANERIRIGLVGCGERGKGAHLPGVGRYAKEENIEVVALADPWRVARDQAAAIVKDTYGKDPDLYVSYRDILARDDIDAVMIASCDHQHTTHLEATAKAGKHVYVEKPIACDFEKLKRSVDAVKEAGVVCQVGTQLRSYSSFTGCREVYRSGILGNVSRIEQRRNGWRPYWYSRLKPVKREDVDWQEFLMDAPDMEFNEDLYSGWYGYRAFNDGPVPQLGVHYIDLVHYITGASFPKSAVCLGGTYTWKDDHNFTCPDQVQAEWEYPEGLFVSYGTNFGNESGNSFRAYGDEAVLDMVDWRNPKLTDEEMRSKKGAIGGTKPVENIDTPDHMLNWLECMRNGETPNASIDAGYQHAVAVIMAMKAFDTGQRQTYDHDTRTIQAG
jgi:predicted dehydrogenase